MYEVEPGEALAQRIRGADGGILRHRGGAIVVGSGRTARSILETVAAVEVGGREASGMDLTLLAPIRAAGPRWLAGKR